MRRFLIMASLLCWPVLANAVECPATLRNDDGNIGGGGISGVGGGGDTLGFAVWQYLNPIFQETFPQLVILLPIDAEHNVQACVYHQHFGQTDEPRLVATLACTGGPTLVWPYGDVHVRCSGPLGIDTLSFAASYLEPELVAVMRRQNAQAIWNTEAMLIGH